MCLAERRDLKDFLSVFLVKNWSLTSHFEVATSDLQSVQWAPDSVTVAILDVRFTTFDQNFTHSLNSLLSFRLVLKLDFFFTLFWAISSQKLNPIKMDLESKQLVRFQILVYL